MSRNIDPYRVSPRDLEYLKQRPRVVQEFDLQGLGNPLEQDAEGNYTYKYLVDDEGNFINGGDGDGDGDPDLVDPEADGAPPVGDPEDGDPEDPDENDPVAELPEDQQWNVDMSRDELREVVKARNETYEDDEKIEVSGQSKDDYLRALEADDNEIRESAED